MKLHPSNAFVTALALTVGLFQPGAASAQDDMKNMPGMAPVALTVSVPTDYAVSAEQKKMDAMPGMAPASSPAVKAAGAASAQAEMDAMPGMAPAKPGTAASGKKGGMAGMPGMAGDAAAKKGGMDAGAAPAQRMSAPGVTVLGPHQKWVPPRGDNRAAELLSQSMLEAHMKGLPPPVEDSMIHSLLLFELLEYRANSSGPETLEWDFAGWIGGDYNRLWIKTEGALDLAGGNRGSGDLQLLYGRIIAPFWDFQIGVRGQQTLGAGFGGNSRTYAVIGVQGLAPYLFGFEPALYISDRGEVSAQLTASFDLLLTQRLVLQPRFEGAVSLQGDDRFGTGKGVNDIELGLRLRYEIRREFAPYIGVSWGRAFGETARIVRGEGEEEDVLSFVAGLRLWY